MQGGALLKAKKLICGKDKWNKPLDHKTSEKWKDFFTSLGATRSNVDKLLDFAGYKEAEEKLIEEGVEVTPIATASHYREAKKLADVNTPEAVATTYTQAVEVFKNDNSIKRGGNGTNQYSKEESVAIATLSKTTPKDRNKRRDTISNKAL